MKESRNKALKHFWRYALESHRETSRSEYVWAFIVYVIPFLILYLVTSKWSTSVTISLTQQTQKVSFINRNPYVLMAYVFWFVPVASLTISRLKTLSRRTAWALLLMFPVFGPGLTCLPCFFKKRGRQELLIPGTPRGAMLAPELPQKHEASSMGAVESGENTAVMNGQEL